jgi:Uncharacterized conserved protein, contains double-stranded beta-helix domain
MTGGKNEVLFGHVVIKILSNSKNLTVSELIIPAGTVADLHSHPHEEVNYVVKGILDFSCGGVTTRLQAGEYIQIPPDTIHNITCCTDSDGLVVSIWSPSREDLVAQAG